MAPCPRCNLASLDDRTYAELLGWYLGDGHIAWSGNKTPLLALSNDRRYTGLTENLLELIRRIKPGAAPYARSRPGCVAVSCPWTHWACLFPQHGPGRKHERRIVLAPWQHEIVTREPGAFLRGLFHSDGCRITNWAQRTVDGQVSRYEYPRYFFSNSNEEIMDLACWLDLVGVAHRHPRVDLLSVARKAAVTEMDRMVGPKT